MSTSPKMSHEYQARPVIAGYGATLAGAFLGGVVVGLLVAVIGYRSSSGLAAGIYAIFGFLGGFICGEVVGGGLLLKLGGHRAASATTIALAVMLAAGTLLELCLTLFGTVGEMSALLGLPALLIGAPFLARWWAIKDLEKATAAIEDGTGKL